MKKIDLKLAIIILQNDSYCENINKDSCCKIIIKKVVGHSACDATYI